MTTDISGKIINRLGNYRLMSIGYLTTIIMQLKLKLSKIHTGDRVKFYGQAIFKRFPESSISIGDFTCFRSNVHSNLIGIKGRCIVATHGKGAIITIGKNCGFSGTVIGAAQKITIGDDVLCGANTLITDFDWHGVDPDKRLTTTGDSKEIVIGKNAFIGYGTVILKGVSIGENSVIGANSVVTRNIPANVIAGGNPCKVLKEIFKT